MVEVRKFKVDEFLHPSNAAKQFQMFDLYVLKEWPVRDVAKTLHANIAQVYLAKHRVTGLIKQETEKLRKRMEAEG